jgi:hypothetical protein
MYFIWKLNSITTVRVGVAVFMRWSARILAVTRGILNEAFPQSLQANAGILPRSFQDSMVIRALQGSSGGERAGSGSEIADSCGIVFRTCGIICVVVSPEK